MLCHKGLFRVLFFVFSEILKIFSFRISAWSLSAAPTDLGLPPNYVTGERFWLGPPLRRNALISQARSNSFGVKIWPHVLTSFVINPGKVTGGSCRAMCFGPTQLSLAWNGCAMCIGKCRIRFCTDRPNRTAIQSLKSKDYLDRAVISLDFLN